MHRFLSGIAQEFVHLLYVYVCVKGALLCVKCVRERAFLSSYGAKGHCKGRYKNKIRACKKLYRGGYKNHRSIHKIP